MKNRLDNKSVLTQLEGLSELIPGPLSHTVTEINTYIQYAKCNIIIGQSKVVSEQTGYIAARDIRQGERVFSVFGTLIGYQTPQHSVQIGYGVHIDPHAYGGRYVNHHCEGNLIIRWDNRGLHHFIAAKDIMKGEEVTYPYWRTEYEWSETATENEVECSCGSPICTGKILSFSQLSKMQKEQAFKMGGIAWYLFQKQPDQ